MEYNSCVISKTKENETEKLNYSELFNLCIQKNKLNEAEEIINALCVLHEKRTKKYKEFIEKAQDNFDLILVDGPPILGLADAVIIANLVEKLLIVIEASATPRNMAQVAMKRLRSANIKPLGVIFNKMKNDPLGYGYDYYYYYAHGYYGETTANPKAKKTKPSKSSKTG